MSDPNWLAVSMPGIPVELRPEDFVEIWDRGSTSPIDWFLEELTVVVTTATPSLVAEDRRSASMLVVRIVGAVEYYLRMILTYACRICPKAQDSSDPAQVSLYAARRYSPDALVLATLDGTSLADVDQVRKRTKQLLGIEINARSPLDVSLNQFSKACQIRHAVAHASGVLGGNNLIALRTNLGPTIAPLELALSVDSMQEIAAVCETVVREFNRHIFRRMIERWLGDQTIVGSWAHDKMFVAPLFELFYSKRDCLAPKSAYGFWKRLMAVI